MLICTNHQEEYKSIMLSTCSFMGAECWCPYCGHTAGLPFGSVEREDDTPETEAMEEKYRIFSCLFLAAKGSRGIPEDELTEENKIRFKKVMKNWKYGVKVEDIKEGEVFEE